MGGASALYATITSSFVISTLAIAQFCLLAYAGARKVRYPYDAALAAVRFRVLRKARKSAGYALGFWELLLGLGAVTPWMSRTAGYFIAATSAAFAFVIGAALLRGERFHCACFGPGDEVSTWSLIRALMFCAVGAMLAAFGISYTNDWAVSIALAASIIGFPVLFSTRASVRRTWRHLDESLDWEWILQDYKGRVSDA